MERISCGRYAEPVNGCTYSKRTGLSSSTTCTSVNCTKHASASRVSSRPLFASASSERTTSGHPWPALSLVYPVALTRAATDSSVVPAVCIARLVVTARARPSACAGVAVPTTHRAPSAPAEPRNPRRLILLCSCCVIITLGSARHHPVE